MAIADTFYQFDRSFPSESCLPLDECGFAIAVAGDIQKTNTEPAIIL